ncbi:MAG: hypothetical protein AAF354_10145 [Pseudomonadota bacterium]
MQITCPCCHARFPIEAALNDDRAREAVAIALRFPPQFSDLLLRYIALFRPQKSALSWQRAGRLMMELSEAIKEGQIQRKGRTWQAPPEHWRLAFELMVAKRDDLKLPLTTHGYLYEILLGMADQVEATAERQQDSERRNRSSDNEPTPQKVAAHLDKMWEAIGRQRPGHED